MRRLLFSPPFTLPRLFELSSSLVLMSLALSSHGWSQFEYYGLGGDTVYSLAGFWGKVYAGTNNGVHVRPMSLGGKEWTLIGLKGKRVRAAYPHTFGPLSYAVTAGIEHTLGDTDSTLIYCSRYSDTSWVPADSGIDRSHVRSIRSIDGFPSPAICGETYAAGSGSIYMGLSGFWQQVFDTGIGVVNAVRTNAANVFVMAGGETAIFAPYITHTHDKGKSWTTAYPNLGGDNACNSLAFDPADTSVIYAGMEGLVIKSTDGGHHWVQTGLTGTPYYFTGLAVDQFTQSVFAGGTTSSGVFGLYRSRDRGVTWTRIDPTIPVGGILCMTTMPTVIPESYILLVGTLNGAIAYSIPFTSARDELHPVRSQLEQNFPNPFNPSTTIRYNVGESAQGRHTYVTLNIYDLLGIEVKTLVAEMQESGTYQTTWDGTDNRRERVSSGMYLYRLTAGTYVSSKPMVLLK